MTNDEQLAMAKLEVELETHNLVNALEEAAITQRTAKDEAYAIQIADYKKKAALEEWEKKSYLVQKEWYDKESQLMAQYGKTQAAGLKAGVLTGAASVPNLRPASYVPQVNAFAAPAVTTYPTPTFAAPFAAPMTTFAGPYGAGPFGSTRLIA